MDSHAASHVSPGPGVSVRPLRLLGDPVLRTACDPVVRFDDALARLVTDLLDTVAEPGRAGLAELLEGLGPCFAQTEPWLQAGKYAAALSLALPAAAAAAEDAKGGRHRGRPTHR